MIECFVRTHGFPDVLFCPKFKRLKIFDAKYIGFLSLHTSLVSEKELRTFGSECSFVLLITGYFLTTVSVIFFPSMFT